VRLDEVHRRARLRVQRHLDKINAELHQAM